MTRIFVPTPGEQERRQRRERLDKAAAAERQVARRVDAVLAERATALDAWSLRMSCAAGDFGHLLVVVKNAAQPQLRAAVVELLITDPLTASVDRVLGAAAARSALAPRSRASMMANARAVEDPYSAT